MKKKLVVLCSLFASAFSFAFLADAPSASAATSFTFTGTTSGTYYIVNSPWAQSVPVTVAVGRTRSTTTGNLGATMICYENGITGDVGVVVPPQNANGTLTLNLRLVGSAADDFMTAMTAGGRAEVAGVEGPFCGISRGLFETRKFVHVASNGKRVYFETRGGNDTVSAYMDNSTVDLGEGKDAAWVFPYTFFYALLDDGPETWDDVYSLNPDFDGEYFHVGNNARACMTDYSGVIRQLPCGGSGAKVFMTTVPAGISRVTDRSNMFCQPILNTSVEHCWQIIESSR